MLTFPERCQTIDAFHNLFQLALITQTLILDDHPLLSFGVFHELVLTEMGITLLADKFETASKLPVVYFS